MKHDLQLIHKLKLKNKTIGFTASTFDVGPHAGHIAMLAECKSKCDFLIVGLLTDPTHDRKDIKNKPVQSIFERWVQLSAVSFVDMIIPFDNENDLLDLLLVVKPDIRFAGEEYKHVDHTGKHIESIKMYYNEREHSFSTTELRKRVVDAEGKK
tara:strand:+ start:1744 stop:2205 length:462 start_codon:yes stop_codon:yes gene_type:complete